MYECRADATLKAGRRQQILTGLCPFRRLSLNPHRVVDVFCPADTQFVDRLCLGQPVLRCPVCGDNFSHAQGVFTLLGGSSSCGLYRGSHLIARESGYDRDAIAVRVHGETCGHRWDVVFQQHEGQTLLEVHVLDPKSGPGMKERRY